MANGTPQPTAADERAPASTFTKRWQLYAVVLVERKSWDATRPRSGR